MPFSPQDANVAAGLPSDATSAQVSAARDSVLAALSIAAIGFAVEFYGLLSGSTAFVSALSVVHSVLHFFGGVLAAWYIVDHWGYLSMWPIVVFFNMLPALLETAVLCARRAGGGR